MNNKIENEVGGIKHYKYIPGVIIGILLLFSTTMIRFIYLDLDSSNRHGFLLVLFMIILLLESLVTILMYYGSRKLSPLPRLLRLSFAVFWGTCGVLQLYIVVVFIIGAFFA